MRKRGIRVVDGDFAREALKANGPKGLFICPRSEAVDIRTSDVRTFYDEAKLRDYLGESKKRVVSKRAYIAIDNACGFKLEKEFATLGEAVNWLTRCLEIVC